MCALQEIDWVAERAAKLLTRASHRVAATADLLKREFGALQTHAHLPTNVMPPAASEFYAQYGSEFPLLSLVADVATVTLMCTTSVERQFRDIREFLLSFFSVQKQFSDCRHNS
jgi:hypothetical protein